MFCSKCGSRLEDGDRFCPACGSPARAAAAPAAPEPRQTPAEPVSQPASPVPPAPALQSENGSGPADRQLPPDRPAGKRGGVAVRTAVILCLVFCLLGAGGGYLLLGRLTGGAAAPGAGQSGGTGDGLSGTLDTGGGTLPGEPAGGTGEETNGASRTWEDPDQLVTAYLQALKASDVDAVLALCDIPEQLEYMDWTSYVERYRAIMQNMYIPNNDPATKAIAEKKLENDITSRLFPIYASVFAGRSQVAEAISSMQPSVYDPDSGGAEEFARLFTEQNLAQISYAAAEIPLERNQDQIWKAIFQNIHTLYGDVVTDYREYGVVLSYDGSYSVHGLTLYQYEDGWKIHSMAASVSHISSSPEYVSAVEGMSMDQVEALAAREYGISPENILYP